MVNELLNALKLPIGHLIHKGHEVYCPKGCLLGALNPVDGSDFIAIGNPADEKMFIPDPSQTALNESLTCKCGAVGASLHKPVTITDGGITVGPSPNTGSGGQPH